MKDLLRVFLGFLPQSLAQRLPLLVLVSFLLGALIAAGTASSFFERRASLRIAETSGGLLYSIISSVDAGQPVPPQTAPFQTSLLAGFRQKEGYQTYPLILSLDGNRFRAAVVFHGTPPLPGLLATSPDADSNPVSRLSDLARNIARQDKTAHLILFLGSGDVLDISAPGIWRHRLGETRIVLIGVLVFFAILTVIIPTAVNLAAPFRRLANPDRKSRRNGLGPLASSEAVWVRDRIERLKEDFKTARDEKTRSLAAISHDLRTPVTRMRLRTELLDDTEIGHKFANDLDEISGLVDGALDLLSIRSQREETLKFSLASLLESLVHDYSDVGKNVTFDPDSTVEIDVAASVFGGNRTLRIAASGESMMTGQPDKLRRAFSNLIDNALKYGKYACVKMRPASAEMLEVDILDGGPGIPPGQQEQLLLPFVRGHSTNAERGAGLGLSIAAEIIDLHKGSLRFSDSDQGFCVTVRINRNNTPLSIKN